MHENQSSRGGEATKEEFATKRADSMLVKLKEDEEKGHRNLYWCDYWFYGDSYYCDRYYSCYQEQL
jgi:hypothetical protein